MIEEHIAKILEELGLDLREPGLAETPARIAKMYREEIFTGLIPSNFPSISLFDAPSTQEISIKNISFVSFCEHHFLPFFGKATITYMPHKKILGLSTIHQIVHYFAKRPQLQERLTEQIAQNLKKILETEDLRIDIEAEHSCVRARGVYDQASTLVTTLTSGHYAFSRLSKRMT